MKKYICIVDGQGGGIGARLISKMDSFFSNCEIIALGTNVAATSAMLKAGTNKGATGDNALIYNCSKADYILGPMGIIIGNGLLGEVSSSVASAISSAEAIKILIPSSSCNVQVVGVKDLSLDQYLDEAIAILKKYINKEQD